MSRSNATRSSFLPVVRRPGYENRRGNTILMGVVIITVISGLVLGFLSVALDSQKWFQHQGAESRLESAAESTIFRAVHDMWGDFRRAYQDKRQAHWDVKFYLDSVGIADQSKATTPVRTDLMSKITLPVAASGNEEMARVEVADVSVWRVDGTSHVQLFVEATVTETADLKSAPVTKTVRQSFLIEGVRWHGLDYAILANNINCVLCHARVDDAERFYNSNPDNFGEYDRVKLGSLESFQVREAPDSWVAGTLYLNGFGLNKDGTPITDWSTVDIASAEFDGQGLLTQDTWGDLVSTTLSPADPLNPMAMENLYLNYAAPDNEQVDGYLPRDFPSPFPDDGGIDLVTGDTFPENAGNRIVDYSEFMAIAAGANGSLSGGNITVSDPTTTVTTDAELTALQAGGTAQLDSMTDGNVYLYGTEANPILLNGNIAVDGDLIIHGHVKGVGALMVSGNVYVPGDLVYSDGVLGNGDRSYGFATDGTENTLAIASGGNVMVGDIFRPPFGFGDDATGDSSGSFNFIMEELSIFNRMEWLKTQPQLPGEKEWTLVSTEIKLLEKWNYETEFYDEDDPVYESVVVTYDEDEPIYEYNDVTYTEDEPVYLYEDVTYDVQEPVYEWVEDGAYKVLIGYDTITKTKTEKTLIGYETVTKTKTVKTQIGTQTVTKSKTVQNLIGYVTVTKSRQVKVGDPWYEEQIIEHYDWVTPYHVNPHYRGATYVPRYYNFTEGGKVPIFNKNGHFDPATATWLSGERPSAWSSSDLTIIDPSDTSNELLYYADGTPKAVLSQLTSTGGWMSNAQLKSMMSQWFAARDVTNPLEIDATIYSANSIFGIIPKRNQAGVDGRMILNGALVAADIGLLAPTELRINFDKRGGQLLDLKADTNVSIRRQLSVPSVHP